MALMSAGIMYDTHANRPAASTLTAGRLYYETDTLTLFRDSGTTWQAVATYNTGVVPAFATPSVALDSSAAAGAASTVIRSDSTIAAFDATAPSTQTYGDSAVVGTAAFAARRDHKHAMPTNPAATNVAPGLVKEPFLFSQVTDVTVANQLGPTTLLSGTIIGTKTAPIGAFYVGRTLVVDVAGLAGNSSVSYGDLLLKLKLGSTIVKTLQFAFAFGPTDINVPWRAQFRVSCRTVGAGGTVKTTAFGEMALVQDSNVSGNDTIVGGWDPGAGNAAVTVANLDTVTELIDLTATWSTAHANNRVTAENVNAHWEG